jgi:ubiquitin thioesterase protein OTUB1
MATLRDFLPKLREVGFEDLVVDDSFEIPRDLITGIIDSEPVSNDGTTLAPWQLLEVFQDDSSTSRLKKIPSVSARIDELTSDCRTPIVSNYLVTFMRMVTSAQIRERREEFEPFLTHPDTGEKMEVKEFCESLVEVLGKEAGGSQHSLTSKFSNAAPCLWFVAGGVCADESAYADHVQLTAISQALKVNLRIAYLDGRSQDGRVEYVTFNHAIDEDETPLTLIYR